MIIRKYNIDIHGVQYLCCLIDKHDFDILRTKNRYYITYEKQEAIECALDSVYDNLDINKYFIDNNIFVLFVIEDIEH